MSWQVAKALHLNDRVIGWQSYLAFTEMLSTSEAARAVGETRVESPGPSPGSAYSAIRYDNGTTLGVEVHLATPGGLQALDDLRLDVIRDTRPHVQAAGCPGRALAFPQLAQ